MKVNTVLGPISPEQMGITNMHEHILWGPIPGWQFSPEANELFNAPEVFRVIYEKLTELKAAGGRTFIDCSGIGLGRDVEFYVSLAKASGVNIVASTGFWLEERIMPYFLFKDIDYLTDLFIKELTRGMGTTTVKAGVIKVGNKRNGFSAFEEMAYRAAARASRATGAAIITHGVNAALRQTEIFLEEKADPRHIVISHCDAAYCLDFERDKAIAKKGFNVGYDHIGAEPDWCPMPYAMSDTKRVELCKTFIEAGYAKNLVISCNVDIYPEWLAPGKKIPPRSYAYLLQGFVPRLRAAGISEETIQLLIVETPKRIIPF